jgi:polysaccharide biosynthesis/export protein
LISFTGCSVVPTAGPTESDVVKQAAESSSNFALVNVDPHVIAALSAEPATEALSGLAASDAPARSVIGVGDTISIVIWDSPNGSILGALTVEPVPVPGAMPPVGGINGANSISLPDQLVGADGAVSIPYVGRIKVADLTPLEVQRKLERLLAKSGVAPRAVVSITKNASQTVTVSGETITGMKVPLNLRGERLLDVIAAAGGSKSAPYETAVRLSRHGETVTIWMDKLISDPAANIYALPGDTVTLLKIPHTFTVFGATTTNLQVPFGAEQVNLAQAVAKAGGLQDARADPEGVFLLRLEPPSVVAALGTAIANPPADQHRSLPVVYHLNLRDMSGYFLAEKIQIRDDDIIYVANARMTDLQKLFTLIGTVTGPAISGVLIGTDFQHTK